MKLTLIRHGMTRGNMLRIYYGSTDLPILPESYAELEARAKTGFYPTAERYYTSGMLPSRVFALSTGTLRTVCFTECAKRTSEILKCGIMPN